MLGELSVQAMMEMDEMNKQLEASIEQITKQVQLLSSLRQSSVAMLRAKLSTISTMLSS